MAQSSTPSVASALSKAGSTFLAALRNGFSTGSATDGDGFSALMDHLSDISQKVQQQTQPDSSNAPQQQEDDATPQKTASANDGQQKTNATKRETTAKDNKASQDSKADDTASDPKQNVATNVTTTKAKTTASSDETTEAKTDSKDEAPVTDPATLANAQQQTVATTAQQTSTTQTQQTTKADAQDETKALSDDEATDQSALETLTDLAEAERNAYLLLQKMLTSSDKSESKKANDSETKLGETQQTIQAVTTQNAATAQAANEATASLGSKTQNNKTKQATTQTETDDQTQTTFDVLAANAAAVQESSDTTDSHKSDLSFFAQDAFGASATQQNASLEPNATSFVTAQPFSVAQASATTETSESSAKLGGVSGTSSTSSAFTTGAGVRSAGSYDFSSTLNATKTGKETHTSSTTVVEQVAVQLRKSASTKENEITLQLRPEELGRVDIKLKFGDDNSVTGTVIADSQTTLDLLSKDVGGLQRALQDAGLRADSQSLQFSLRDGNQNAFSHNQNQGNANDNGSSMRSNATINVISEAETENVSSLAEIALPGRVNLKV